jgi:hypothetical protein
LTLIVPKYMQCNLSKLIAICIVSLIWVWFTYSQRLLYHLAFHSLDCERTWWQNVSFFGLWTYLMTECFILWTVNVLDDRMFHSLDCVRIWWQNVSFCGLWTYLMTECFILLTVNVLDDRMFHSVDCERTWWQNA